MSNDWDGMKELWASTVHGLRMAGWSRIDAENEADDRIERLRDKSRARRP